MSQSSGGVRGDALRKIFEIVMPDGLQRVLHHHRDARHARVAIGIDEIHAAIHEHVFALRRGRSQHQAAEQEQAGETQNHRRMMPVGPYKEIP
jgi:hypothetical protein